MQIMLKWILLVISFLEARTVSAGTLKNRRASGIMISDEMYFGSGFEDEDIWNTGYNDVAMKFRIDYDKPFEDRLLLKDAPEFRSEVKRLERYFKGQIARNVGVIAEDIDVDVHSFSPATSADITVTVPGYFGIAVDELRKAVTDIMAYGEIEGYSITNIRDCGDDCDIPGNGNESVLIDLEMTYQYDTSGEIDLSSHESPDFLAEATMVQNELPLHLVAKLAENGIIISPDQIKIEVLNFVSVGINTAVTLTVQAEGITIEQMSEALNLLVIADEVGINGRTIISIEELNSYDDDDRSITEEVMPVMNHESIETTDEEPPPDLVIGEVMPDMPKEVFDESEPMVPELVGVFDNEPLPPDFVYPDEPVPPFPEELPDHCALVQDPERGSHECDNGNKIDSICSFTCQYGTRLEGAERISCDRDGVWSADAPYCVRIFCQPHIIQFENGVSVCSDHNTFASVCSFSCYEKHHLEGPSKIKCLYNSTWSEQPPTCEPDPVNCQEEYGPWSECISGYRSKAETVVTTSTEVVVCPEIREECLDCILEWGEWSSCSDRSRKRVQFVAQRKVGAGKECPNIQEQSEDCIDCRIEWGDWSSCDGGVRMRSQFVAVQPVGQGAECPPTESQKEDCIDCRIEWSEWGECADGTRKRSQYVAQSTVGAGAECTPLETQTEVCVDCVLVWEEWSECLHGTRGRQMIVRTPQQGAGRSCGEQRIEVEDCVDCEVEWGLWGDCSDGFRTRSQFVLIDHVGAGAACPELRSEIEKCVDCVMEWGVWGDCMDGIRERTEVILTEAVGVGELCREPSIETKDCSQCILEWEPWGDCVDERRTRKQYILQQPINVENNCPELLTQTEDCVDCLVEWGKWGECEEGQQYRKQIVVRRSVGAGATCPELKTESLACSDCKIEWGLWSSCAENERNRSEFIVVQPRGNVSPCRDLQTQFENCRDCVIDWGEWSECTNSERIRSEVVVANVIGGGRTCPELRRDFAACANCRLEWEPWTPCDASNQRSRAQFVSLEPFGGGTECPEIQFETEECVDCEVVWSDWGECSSGQREKHQYIVKQSVGAGRRCPVLEKQTERCVDCLVDWKSWSSCSNGERSRKQYIRVRPVGAGTQCPELLEEIEICIHCQIEWGEWSECTNGRRTKPQYISQETVGAGRQCPRLETLVEACVDCEVEWLPWSLCFQGSRSRKQRISVPLVGAGKECPPLEKESEECSEKSDDIDELVCRFTRQVLGYGKRPQLRDVLLIGDESGSIGWVNYEKIKKSFQAIASQIRGGIGTQDAQIAMSSFARYSRTVFMLDAYDDLIDVNEAIERAFYQGGYRSNIGQALIDANSWVFQQTGGMRSFPNIDDNIVHEILIATDGCRTSDIYKLKEGLKTIKKRGIKLYVLAVASQDIRCKETVESMVEDSDDLFQLGDWSDLDRFVSFIESESCVEKSRGDGEPEESFVAEQDNVEN